MDRDVGRDLLGRATLAVSHGRALVVPNSTKSACAARIATPVPKTESMP
ncbi:hypothetical protein [Streptomyces abikoensis]